MKRTSIVIPAWERPAELWRCLNTLQQFRGRPGVEIVVSDDCSQTYHVANVVKTLFMADVALRNEAQLGFAGNCNAAAHWLADRGEWAP